MSRAIAALAVFGGLFFTSTAAEAKYDYCNNTSYVLRAAIAYKDEGEWVSRGWWTLLPGKCRTVLPQELKAKAYYTYAETVPGHRGGIKYFAGHHRFCTKDGYFTIHGRDDCTTQGYSAGSFVEVQVGKAKSWTTTFEEPADFTRKKAEIAGVQRLLADIGYNPGKIDGELGRKTRRAIAAFKRAHGITVSGLISEELINALAETANTAAEEMGFNFCNNTDQQLWTAIAFKHNKDWISRGWWMLEPGDCARVLKDSLAAQTYYVYAAYDTPEGEVVVSGGDEKFCTSDVKFSISGRDECETRGYISTGFLKVDVGKTTAWTQHFSQEADLASVSE